MSFIEFLKKNKHDGSNKDINADKAFMRSIAISFFAIIICVVMLSASTFAWFSTTLESENTISTSVYKLEISVVGGTETAEPEKDEDGNLKYSLTGGVTYTVTITALEEGTTGKTGYVKLLHDGTQLCSEQIDRGDTISFTLNFKSYTELTLIECWGTSSIPEDERDLHNGDVYEQN